MARASSPVLLALAAVLIALPVLAFFPTSAGAQRSTLFNGDPCPTVLYANREQLTCSCGKTEGQHDVWGTDIYTDDSALCHAAKHFGAIDEAGGIINVRRAPGRSNYEGSTRNGFTSADYGAWERSIVFDSADTVAKSLGGVSICPVQYNAGVAGWSGECRCMGGETGIVWGTDIYTSDSVVCRAARHAGAVGPSGGVVRVTAAPGQQSYAGSNRNGVQTDSYGSWPASFRISAAAD